MASIVIKAAPDADLYMLWSSVSDSCVFVGSRSEVASEDGVSEDALRRADERGTSDRKGAEGAWQKNGLNGLIVETTEHRQHDVPLFLDRENFAEFARLLLADQTSEAEHLLRPLEDV